MKTNEHTFLGTGWSFPTLFDDNNHEVIMRSNFENIQESIRVIISTMIGERIMRPFFGCDLREDVFEAMNNTEITRVKNKISDSLKKYEPRIIIESIEIDMTNIMQGKLEIWVEYTVIATNSRMNIVFPYYHEEATDI